MRLRTQKRLDSAVIWLHRTLVIIFLIASVRCAVDGDGASNENKLEERNVTLRSTWPFSDLTNLFGNKDKAPTAGGSLPPTVAPFTTAAAAAGGAEPMDPSLFGGFERHPCRRVCQDGQSLTCYYKLVVHNYQRLGPECNRCLHDEKACASEHCIYGDGFPTALMAVNGMVPGPSIEVCENDTLIVDVLNYLSEGTTMHWHGLHMKESPEMDGVPFVTQYPIQPSEAYRYAFKADRSGTVWYHSQEGLQRALGVAGSIVIRQHRQANPHAHLYDYDLIEHTLLIGDIVYNYNFDRVANILINGKGRSHQNSLPDNDPRHRYERLRVSPGYRYRMRVISNAVFDCPIEFSIENHRMLVISTDGNDILPLLADSFFMGSGERFDFVLDASQYANNYWIRVRGYNNCSMQNLYQGAVLHYRGAARNEPPFASMDEVRYGLSEMADDKVTINELDEFKINPKMDVVARPTSSNRGDVAISNSGDDATLNNADVSTTDTADVATSALQSLELLPWPRYTKFLTYYSSFGQRRDRYGAVSHQIDDITYAPPSLSLLQARRLFQDYEYFCNRSSMYAAGHDCVRDNCECTNVLRLPAYKPIELVVVNYMTSAQPFHAHGYTFRLVGQGVIGSVAELRQVPELDRRGRLQRTADDFPAVKKDSVQVPALGYIILRFISDNPGFWLYHCHNELQTVSGMAAVLRVGENHQMRAVPPRVRC